MSTPTPEGQVTPNRRRRSEVQLLEDLGGRLSAIRDTAPSTSTQAQLNMDPNLAAILAQMRQDSIRAEEQRRQDSIRAEEQHRQDRLAATAALEAQAQRFEEQRRIDQENHNEQIRVLREGNQAGAQLTVQIPKPTVFRNAATDNQITFDRWTQEVTNYIQQSGLADWQKVVDEALDAEARRQFRSIAEPHMVNLATALEHLQPLLQPPDSQIQVALKLLQVTCKSNIPALVQEYQKLLARLNNHEEVVKAAFLNCVPADQRRKLVQHLSNPAHVAMTLQELMTEAVRRYNTEKSVSNTVGERTATGTRGGISCSFCHKPGHTYQYCKSRQRVQTASTNNSTRPQLNAPNQGLGLMQRQGGGACATQPPYNCYNCKKPGHLSRDCPQSGRNSARGPDAQRNGLRRLALDEPGKNTRRLTDPAMMEVYVGRGAQKRKALLDTGADINTLSHEVAEPLLTQEVVQPEGSLTVVGPFGTQDCQLISVPVSRDGHQFANVEFAVLPKGTDVCGEVLLPQAGARKLGVHLEQRSGEPERPQEDLVHPTAGTPKGKPEESVTHGGLQEHGGDARPNDPVALPVVSEADDLEDGNPEMFGLHIGNAKARMASDADGTHDAHRTAVHKVHRVEEGLAVELFTDLQDGLVLVQPTEEGQRLGIEEGVQVVVDGMLSLPICERDCIEGHADVLEESAKGRKTLAMVQMVLEDDVTDILDRRPAAVRVLKKVLEQSIDSKEQVVTQQRPRSPSLRRGVVTQHAS